MDYVFHVYSNEIVEVHKDMNCKVGQPLWKISYSIVASNKCKELKEAQSLLYILSKFGGAEHEIFFKFLQILL
jgi:hypothetical protein